MMHLKSKHKPILILSVHCSDKWVRLQHQFISKNTDNFQIALYLNNTSSHQISKLIKDIPNINIVHTNKSDMPGIDQHLTGLRFLANYASSHQERFRSFLILDSDCFPFNRWEQNLKTKMLKYNKTSASMMRYDNLTTYNHPAIVYTKRTQDLIFKHNQLPNLLGIDQPDPTHAPDQNPFPLIRSNKINLHPLAFGVYFDSFYHHAAGSRNKDFTINKYIDYEYNSNHELLFWKDPPRFINFLTQDFSDVLYET